MGTILLNTFLLLSGSRGWSPQFCCPKGHVAGNYRHFHFTNIHWFLTCSECIQQDKTGLSLALAMQMKGKKSNLGETQSHIAWENHDNLLQMEEALHKEFMLQSSILSQVCPPSWAKWCTTVTAVTAKTPDWVWGGLSVYARPLRLEPAGLLQQKGCRSEQ